MENSGEKQPNKRPKGAYGSQVRKVVAAYLEVNRDRIKKGNWTQQKTFEECSLALSMFAEMNRPLAWNTFIEVSRDLDLEYKRKERCDKNTKRKPRMKASKQLLLFDTFPAVTDSTIDFDHELYNLLSRESLKTSGVMAFVGVLTRFKEADDVQLEKWRFALDAVSRRVPLKKIRDQLFDSPPDDAANTSSL